MPKNRRQTLRQLLLAGLAVLTFGLFGFTSKCIAPGLQKDAADAGGTVLCIDNRSFWDVEVYVRKHNISGRHERVRIGAGKSKTANVHTTVAEYGMDLVVETTEDFVLPPQFVNVRRIGDEDTVAVEIAPRELGRYPFSHSHPVAGNDACRN